MSNWKEGTKAVKAGEEDFNFGAVVAPIFQSAMYEFGHEKEYRDIPYMRMSNSPNHKALHIKLAQLEMAPAALVTSSGMSAISTALLANLKSGDHALFHKSLYGGTYSFVTEDLPKFGIEYSFIDANNSTDWQNHLQKNTQLIYVETLSNPLVQIPDLSKIVDFAKEHKLLSFIDNTFASPINFKPIPFGFDLSLHSATKYLNGHSDLVAGAVIGSEHLVKKVSDLANHLGGSLDAHACFLLQRGMKTLHIRMREHESNALKVAQFLESHDKVIKVNYPGLENSPNHSRSKKWLQGNGGVLSFELSDDVDASAFIEKLQLFVHATSLGGVESLVTRPSTSSHMSIPREDRLKVGLKDELIRLSIGIEDSEDLIADINNALKS